jgi:hypothetical protein
MGQAVSKCNVLVLILFEKKTQDVAKFATSSVFSYFFDDVLKCCKYIFILIVVFFIKIVGDFCCQSFW